LNRRFRQSNGQSGPSNAQFLNAILHSVFGDERSMPQPLKILNIVGARPNLPKIAPLMHEMQRHPEIEAILVHTGQHYDEKLSDIFFRKMCFPSSLGNWEVGYEYYALQSA